MVDVVRQRGSVAWLHALDPLGAPAGRAADADPRPSREPAVWWCDPTDSALVLGSRHSVEVIDPAAVAAAGLTVTTRRSGGGAVIVRRGSVVWIDVILPHGAADDVRASMLRVGECWAAVLAPALCERGLGDPLAVHRGGMVSTPWSDLVCFAGIGPGEVLLGGRKLVGLSQRRTRFGARVQGLLYRAPSTAQLGGMFRGDVPSEAPEEPAWLDWVDAGSVARGLAAELQRVPA